MSILKFNINTDEIAQAIDATKEQIKKDLQRSVGNLAEMTHAKTLELARDELGSLSQTYMDNVEFSNPSPNFWVVTLKAPAMWIEDGRKSGFMEELLNGKSSKTSMEGKKYAVIPFQHNVNPSQQSPNAKNIANEIKSEFKRRGLNWKKIERDASGSPRVGKLHSFNLESARLKDIHKTPVTYGVTVYQNKQKDGSVKRDVMTFRIIHEDHKSEGLWNHPGRQGNKLFDKAFDWAMNTWEKDILPAMLEKYNRN